MPCSGLWLLIQITLTIRILHVHLDLYYSRWVKCSIRICSSLRRFYFLKGVIWLGLGLRINIITSELHIRILHLGQSVLTMPYSEMMKTI